MAVRRVGSSDASFSSVPIGTAGSTLAFGALGLGVPPKMPPKIDAGFFAGVRATDEGVDELLGPLPVALSMRMFDCWVRARVRVRVGVHAEERGRACV
jgi:hypothetical protein